MTIDSDGKGGFDGRYFLDGVAVTGCDVLDRGGRVKGKSVEYACIVHVVIDGVDGNGVMEVLKILNCIS